MSDPKETSGVAVILAIAAAAVSVAGVVAYEEVKDAPAKTETELRAESVKLEANVFPVRDDKGGATIYVAKLSDGGVAKLDQSPCARKPTPAADCKRVLPGGKTVDFGVDNTMEAGQWVGVGCVRTACVVVAGEAPEAGAP